VVGSHVYSQQGRYSTTVMITDLVGGNSATATSLVHVARSGAPPTHLLDVATRLTHSQEYFTDIVTNAYLTYLGREPDSPGLGVAVASLSNGYITDEQLEANFIGSAEYIQNHGGAGAGWVRGMYHDLLGRVPRDDEVQAWVAYLNQGGSTVTVAYEFAASGEREAIRVRNDYRTYLGRTPRQDEVDGWVNAFENHQTINEDVIAGFVGSQEYFNDHYANAADWIFSAYHDILNRLPDTTGYNGWLAYLEGN
jgi:hypothetical protein